MAPLEQQHPALDDDNNVVNTSSTQGSTLHCRNKSTSTNSNQQRADEWFRLGKYTASLSLLIYCLYLIIRGILARQTPMAQSTNPVLALLCMGILLFWLGVLEGGQGSIVGLQPINPQAYQHSHPIAFATTQLAHAHDNLNRFIIGRQFLVVLVVFCLNLCTTAHEHALLPGCNPWMVEALLSSGLASMFITVLLGQLSAEVNATNCMLDFINNHTVRVTTQFCLLMEASGILHAVYILKWFFSCDEDAVRDVKTISYRLRVILSCVVLVAALTVTWAALCENETSMGLSALVSIPLFILLVIGLGILEAMQIAVFAVVKLPPSAIAAYPTAKANCELVFRGDNFKAFLIGRQICVTTCMFLLARLTTTVDGPPPPPPDGMLPPPPPLDGMMPPPLDDTMPPLPPPTVLGVPQAVQAFFNTGLPGALITTIVASLYWRIVAATFPVYFMNSGMVNMTLRVCLFLEATGLFSSAWLLADLIRYLVGFGNDDLYLKKKEEKPMEEVDESSSLLTDLTRSSSSDSWGYDSAC